MSPPILTHLAREDLRRIAARSIRDFGPNQARRYLRRIDRAMADLGSGSRRGRILLDTRPLDLCFLVGVHYVVYRARDDGRILIVRVLHSRMELSSHL